MFVQICFKLLADVFQVALYAGIHQVAVVLQYKAADDIGVYNGLLRA